MDLREPQPRLAGAGQVITELEHGEQITGDGFGLLMHTSGTTGVPKPDRDLDGEHRGERRRRAVA